MLVGSSLWGPLLVLAGVTAVAHSRSASNLIATAMGRASAALHARGDHICSYKPPRLQVSGTQQTRRSHVAVIWLIRTGRF